MKRLIALLAVGAAVAAVLAVPSVAGDTKGPPCANIVYGTGSYAYYEAGFRNAAREPVRRLDLVLDAPACDGDDVQAGDLRTCKGRACWPRLTSRRSLFLYTFAQGTAPAEGVCIVGTTFFRGRAADRAPDEGCASDRPPQRRRRRLPVRIRRASGPRHGACRPARLRHSARGRPLRARATRPPTA